ncbi:hypothetical protein GF312_20885 [Candidatus Poribacteria bacterium]|nr:hypothetical protein [Candidatus Poribacteria bacterium]
MFRKVAILTLSVLIAVSLCSGLSAQEWYEMREPEGSPLINIPKADRALLDALYISVMFITAEDLAMISPIYNALDTLPGIDVRTWFDSSAGTPDMATLLEHDVVIVWASGDIADTDTLGDALAYYADLGGGVIVASPSRFPGIAIGGRFMDDGYDPLMNGSGPLGGDVLGANDLHNIMSIPYAITAIWGDGREETELRAGADLVAWWSDGNPMVATKGNVVGITLYLGDEAGTWWDGHVPQLLANICNWLVGNTSVAWTFVYADMFADTGSGTAVPLLRHYRDTVLINDVDGETLVGELYEDHSEELARILMKHPWLRHRCAIMIAKHLKDIHDVLEGGQMRLTKHQLWQILWLLRDISRYASPEFRAYIRDVQITMLDKDQMLDFGVIVSDRLFFAPKKPANNLTTSWGAIRKNH